MFKDGIYDFFFQILWLSKFFHSETKKKKKKTEKKRKGKESNTKYTG